MKVNSHTTQKDIVKDLEVNSYKDVMLKEPNKKRDLVSIEKWSIFE